MNYHMIFEQHQLLVEGTTQIKNRGITARSWEGESRDSDLLYYTAHLSWVVLLPASHYPEVRFRFLTVHTYIPSLYFKRVWEFSVSGCSTCFRMNIIWCYCVVLPPPAATREAGIFFLLHQDRCRWSDRGVFFVILIHLSLLFSLSLFSLFTSVTTLIITFWRRENQIWRSSNAITCSFTNHRFKLQTGTCAPCDVHQSSTVWEKNSTHTRTQGVKNYVPLMRVHDAYLCIFHAIGK